MLSITKITMDDCIGDAWEVGQVIYDKISDSSSQLDKYIGSYKKPFCPPDYPNYVVRLCYQRGSLKSTVPSYKYGYQEKLRLYYKVNYESDKNLDDLSDK